MGRNKYPEETVAKILDAALELFCAQGYEGTSIQDIVDRLDGMTKGAVYHHFKSKEEIFNAAFDRAMAPVVEARQKLFEDRRLDGAQKLQRLYSADSIVPQVELWRRMSPATDPIKSSRLLAIQFQGTFDESANRFLLPIIREGVADGSLTCEYPEQAAEAIALLANLWLIPLFRPNDSLEAMLARAECLSRMSRALGIDLGQDVCETTKKVWNAWTADI